MRKPHNFQPRLLEFPQSEPRQKISLCAEILRLGEVVMTIPSGLMGVAAWFMVEQDCWNWHSSIYSSSAANSSTQSCLWADLPWAVASGWLWSQSIPVSLQCWVCAPGEQPSPGGLTEVLAVYSQAVALPQALLPLPKQLCLLFVMAELHIQVVI